MSWVVERMRPDRDLDEVLAIEEASFSNPWTREMYLHELENPDASVVHVLRVSGPPGGPAPGPTVAGFCAVWVVLDELHINNLAIHPRWRGRGFGAALLEHALEAGAQRGATRATLEVRRSNDAAIRLYQRLGFRIVATRPNYYTNPSEDALILWREGPPAAGGRA